MNIYWMRRDLRLEDNPALKAAVEDGGELLIVFIFDSQILQHLREDDKRVSLIYQRLISLNSSLNQYGARIRFYHGEPDNIWQDLVGGFKPEKVYWNRDYEPMCRERDSKVYQLLESHEIELKSFQDHLLVEPGHLLKADGNPYTIYTPFKNKWRSLVPLTRIKEFHVDLNKVNWFHIGKESEVTLTSMGFTEQRFALKEISWKKIADYEKNRDFPALDHTTQLSPYIRFGMVGYRQIWNKILKLKVSQIEKEKLISELIWREFFVHILFHFPHSANANFKSKYDGVLWRLNFEEYDKICKRSRKNPSISNPKNLKEVLADLDAWKNGETGYPLVDAGIRELNQTGYMHNRVRMIVASFLVKHLLIDWRIGERYFAERLIDYEASSNVGNWQWAAGTGCDSAPYFRIFNPHTQLKKFDGQATYVRKWIPEVLEYPLEIVEHQFARKRCLETYRLGLE